MTALAIVLGCLTLILVIGMIRRKPGRAVTDITILVIVFGILGIVNLVAAQFIDTGDAAQSVAVVFAGGFALDWIYGLMAPQRQRRRDRRLRELMQRRRV